MVERLPPAPELLAEARAFTAQIGAMLDLPADQRGQLRFTITVPQDFAILAAWIMFKEDMRRDGEPVVLPRPVTLHFEDGRQTRDWQRARAYFQRAIFESFDRDYTHLLVEDHPLLFPSPPALPARDGGVEDIDDDIPF